MDELPVQLRPSASWLNLRQPGTSDGRVKIAAPPGWSERRSLRDPRLRSRMAEQSDGGQKSSCSIHPADIEQMRGSVGDFGWFDIEFSPHRVRLRPQARLEHVCRPASRLSTGWGCFNMSIGYQSDPASVTFKVAGGPESARPPTTSTSISCRSRMPVAILTLPITTAASGSSGARGLRPTTRAGSRPGWTASMSSRATTARRCGQATRTRTSSSARTRVRTNRSLRPDGRLLREARDRPPEAHLVRAE